MSKVRGLGAPPFGGAKKDSTRLFARNDSRLQRS